MPCTYPRRLRRFCSVKGVSRAVNRIAIADHLCHRWPDPEETYFEQVRRLPPANVVTVTAVGVSRRQYWDPDPIDQPTRWATDDELDQFESVLDRAVSRAMGFGPTGIFLSGGFDSISVAAFATDIARRTAQPRSDRACRSRSRIRRATKRSCSAAWRRDWGSIRSCCRLKKRSADEGSSKRRRISLPSGRSRC